MEREMAAEQIHSEQDLSCPVCYDIFKDPILLSCSHNVCRECLEVFWRKKERQECPVCKQLNQHYLVGNVALKSLCAAHLKEYNYRYLAGSEQYCSIHNEKLKFYCLEDKQTVCLICQVSQQHNDHEVYSIDEVADHLRRELKTALKPLQQKQDRFNQVKQSYHKTTAHIKRQAHYTEQKIKNEFKKLYHFLQLEEESRLLALQQEEEQKIQMMEENIEKINKEIASLSTMIRAIEEEMWTADFLFVQNFEASIARARCPFPGPQMVSGALIDEAKHVGNLAFRTWMKMKDIVKYSPVILDPNTAHTSLILSDDLTSAMCDETQDMTYLPDNPERFKSTVCVLGAEGFDSGSHCWDIDCGNRSLWEVGITTEDTPVNREAFHTEVWSVVNQYGFYSRSPAQPKNAFSAEGGLERVKIQLDWDKGQVSFFDPVDETCIVTFNHTFTKKVYPFFWIRRDSPVTILPMTILPTTILDGE